MRSPRVFGSTGVSGRLLLPLIRLPSTSAPALHIHAGLLSRNACARRAVKTLLSLDVPYSEGTALKQWSASLPLSVHVLPSSAVQSTPIHIVGYPRTLTQYPVLLVSSDGALAGTAMGGGVAVYAPGYGMVLTASYGRLVLGCTPTLAERYANIGTPTLAERYAKIVALHLLQDWRGTLVLLADAAKAQFAQYTTYPPPQTPVDALFQ